jgi:hypothetical protein
MAQCWDLDPDKRRTMSDLVLTLSRLTTRSPENEDYLEPSCTYEALQNIYVNAEAGLDYTYSSLQKDDKSEEI